MKTGSLSCRNLTSREFMGTYDLFFKDFHKVITLHWGWPASMSDTPKGHWSSFSQDKECIVHTLFNDTPSLKCSHWTRPSWTPTLPRVCASNLVLNHSASSPTALPSFPPFLPLAHSSQALSPPLRWKYLVGVIMCHSTKQGKEAHLQCQMVDGLVKSVWHCLPIRKAVGWLCSVAHVTLHFLVSV